MVMVVVIKVGGAEEGGGDDDACLTDLVTSEGTCAFSFVSRENFLAISSSGVHFNHGARKRKKGGLS